MTADQMCGARTARDFCHLPKGQGTSHPGYGNCSTHLGTTPAANKAAAREMGRDLILGYKSSIRWGGDRTDPSIASLTPEQALLEEVRRSAAMVRFLEERIGQWGIDVTSATVETFLRLQPGKSGNPPDVKAFLDSLDSDDPDSSSHLPELIDVNANSGISSFTNQREWLYLYREERQHLVRTAKTAIDAGIAQKIVSLAQDQGRILASALKAVLSALNLSPQQQELVPTIVPPVLRAVAADQPVPDITSLLPRSEAS